MDRVLYQFPISHYCEKVRWVLDVKRLPYRIENQLPGPHAWANRMRTGKTTVPVLVEDGNALSGSHRIALHLEAYGGGPRLLPKSEAARAELESLATYFDRQVGPAVRRYAYGLIIPRTELFRELFFRNYTGKLARTFATFMAKPIGLVIAQMYAVNAPSAGESPQLIRAAADRVEALLGGSDYLFEGEFSLADITVGSLLAPLIGPPESPWADEIDIPELRALRAELRARPIGRYIQKLYATRHANG